MCVCVLGGGGGGEAEGKAGVRGNMGHAFQIFFLDFSFARNASKTSNYVHM